MRSLRRILVPLDFGDASNEALLRAVLLARPFDASITILHVVHILTLPDSVRAFSRTAPPARVENEARERLEEAASKLGAEYPHTYAVMRRGLPADEILSALEDTRADLVVMGTGGEHALAYAQIGSVAEEVVRSSPVPVLTVRPRARSLPATIVRDFSEPSARRETQRDESSRVDDAR
jgi:nucleotide-binding universal stress UspA family protein